MNSAEPDKGLRGGREPVSHSARRKRVLSPVGSFVVWAVIGMTISTAAASVIVRVVSGFGPMEWRRGVLAPGDSGVERIELDLDLRHPPRMNAVATLHGSGDRSRVRFILNRALRIDRATDGHGNELRVRHGPKLRSSYHTEARIVSVGAPAQDAWAMRVEYSGRGMDGSEGSDWMGILLLADDEIRMSKQTAFHPTFEPDPHGPGAALMPASVRIRAPAGFEVYAPGQRIACEDDAWCFESPMPTTLSVFAAPRVRTETTVGGSTVVTLLSEEHAHLAGEIADASRSVLGAYSSWWGPVQGQTLGICETFERGSSYNWASHGIMAMERGSLQKGGIPLESLAHEIGHIWWGQAVVMSGRGERFLAEGLAEYAAWRYIESVEGENASKALAERARENWLRGVYAEGTDPAMVDVTFATPRYQTLAYDKAPLVWRSLERRIGREAMDALLRAFIADSEGLGDLEGMMRLVRARIGDVGAALPWIERPGHAHIELDGLEHVDGEMRGLVIRRPIPGGIPHLAPDTVVVRARWGDRVASVEVEATDSSASFSIPCDEHPLLVELDPDGQVLGTIGQPAYFGPARLLSSEPVDGAREVPLGTLEVRLFHEAPLLPLPADFARRVEVLTRPGGTVRRGIEAAKLADGGTTLVLHLGGTYPGTEYELALPEGLMDADGIPIPRPRIAFRTRETIDSERPRIVHSYPAAGTSDVPPDLREIRVVFSEPMRTSTGFSTSRVRELEAGGWAYPRIGFGHWEDDRTLVWHLQTPLRSGRRYALPFGWHFRDMDGNSLADWDLKFETSPAGR